MDPRLKIAGLKNQFNFYCYSSLSLSLRWKGWSAIHMKVWHFRAVNAFSKYVPWPFFLSFFLTFFLSFLLSFFRQTDNTLKSVYIYWVMLHYKKLPQITGRTGMTDHSTLAELTMNSLSPWKSVQLHLDTSNTICIYNLLLIFILSPLDFPSCFFHSSCPYEACMYFLFLPWMPQ